MSKLKTFVFGFLFFVMCCMTPACSTEQPPKISISGSTTILPFMTKISEIYLQDVNATIQINGGGSIKGIKELIDGRCNIAMSSSPIPEDIFSRAESRGIQMREFPFAEDIIVPIVHPNNPVHNLTLDQLQGIYTGKIKFWNALGWVSKPIDVVARGASSGTAEIWKQIVMKSKNIQSRAVFQNSNSAVLAYVAEHSDAIGYISLALRNHEVKPVFVNGVAPKRENAKTHQYPISRRLYLYVDEKKFSHPIKSLIAFILSRKGRQIAKECGFIPLKPLG